MQERIPSLLTSYVSLKPFLRNRETIEYRDWVLDSGAYSALTSGKIIYLENYIADVYQLLKGPKPPSIVFALDVIGNPEQSLINALRMREAGLDIVPCFHYGSPWEHLIEMNKQFDKIALGGLVQRGAGGHGSKLGVTDRIKFLEQCFARVWPKWTHGFGCADERLLKVIPFCSVDATTWYYRASRYGALLEYGAGTACREKNNPVAFTAAVKTQIAISLKQEYEARGRFGKILKKEGLPQFDLRLATSGAPGELKHMPQRKPL